MRRKLRIFGADALLDMARRVRAGQGAADITAAYDTSATMLYRVLDAAGIPRPPVVSLARAATILAMRDQRASLAEIAAACGCTRDTVNNHLRRVGPRLLKPLPGQRKALMAARDVLMHGQHAALRRCLCCSRTFNSQHVGNRRCFDCLRNAHTVDSPYGA